MHPHFVLPAQLVPFNRMKGKVSVPPVLQAARISYVMLPNVRLALLVQPMLTLMQLHPVLLAHRGRNNLVLAYLVHASSALQDLLTMIDNLPRPVFRVHLERTSPPLVLRDLVHPIFALVAPQTMMQIL